MSQSPKPLSPVLPQWIAQMYASKTGRDHLGLGSVASDQILPSLVPGINVLTLHPRYHSFYVFLLDEFWRRDGLPRTRKAWVKFFRPRDFIFSVAAHLCDRPEHQGLDKIVGSRHTQPLAQQETVFDTTTHYIESELGGYGLYYRSVMIDLGLVYPGGPGLPYPVDVPTEEKGQILAAAYREAVQATDYYQRYFDKDKTIIPRAVVRAYGRAGCLCQLKRRQAPDRSLLLAAFLQAGPIATARRDTLRLFLDLNAQTKAYAIDHHAFRQLVYFGQAENGATYRPLPALAETHRRWRLYQAHEYYAFALNFMWAYLCDWGLTQQSDVRPLSLAKLWDEVETALNNFKALCSALRIKSPPLTSQSPFQALLDWLKKIQPTPPTDFDQACTLHSPINEAKLYDLCLRPNLTLAMVVGSLLLMLGLIYLRFANVALTSQPEWAIAQMGGDERLSLAGFIQQLRRRLQNGPATLCEIAHWLINDYIILQHLMVAATKLPENTFRFQREGERLRFYNLENPVTFQSSRFEAISATLTDFGLCAEFNTTGRTFPAQGRALRDTGSLEGL